jgi:predicted ArsR family transcriptional regulator
MIKLSVGNMRLHLKKLVEKGWISERTNPEHKWDRTKQYRFNATRVANNLFFHSYFGLPFSHRLPVS